MNKQSVIVQIIGLYNYKWEVLSSVSLLIETHRSANFDWTTWLGVRMEQLGLRVTKISIR